MRRPKNLPDDVDARFGELEAEIERLEAKRQAYDPDDIARGGAFVILNHDGTVADRTRFHPGRGRETPSPKRRAGATKRGGGDTESGDGQAAGTDESGDG